MGRRGSRVPASPLRPASVICRRPFHHDDRRRLAEIPARTGSRTGRRCRRANLPGPRGWCAPSHADTDARLPRCSPRRGVLRHRRPLPDLGHDAGAGERVAALERPRSRPAPSVARGRQRASADPGRVPRRRTGHGRCSSRPGRRGILRHRRPLRHQSVGSRTCQRPLARQRPRARAAPSPAGRSAVVGVTRTGDEGCRARGDRSLVGCVRRRPTPRARSRLDGVRFPVRRRLERRSSRRHAVAADDLGVGRHAADRSEDHAHLRRQHTGGSPLPPLAARPVRR